MSASSESYQLEIICAHCQAILNDPANLNSHPCLNKICDNCQAHLNQENRLNHYCTSSVVLCSRCYYACSVCLVPFCSGCCQQIERNLRYPIQPRCDKHILPRKTLRPTRRTTRKATRAVY